MPSASRRRAATEEHSSNRGTLSREALKVTAAVQGENTRASIHVYFYIILLNVCVCVSHVCRIGTLARQLMYIIYR